MRQPVGQSCLAGRPVVVGGVEAEDLEASLVEKMVADGSVVEIELDHSRNALPTVTLGDCGRLGVGGDLLNGLGSLSGALPVLQEVASIALVEVDDPGLESLQRGLGCREVSLRGVFGMIVFQ